MGSNSTSTTKRRSRTSNTGRTVGSERPAPGADDSARGLAAGNQKKDGQRRKGGPKKPG